MKFLFSFLALLFILKVLNINQKTHNDLLKINNEQINTESNTIQSSTTTETPEFLKKMTNTK